MSQNILSTIEVTRNTTTNHVDTNACFWKRKPIDIAIRECDYAYKGKEGIVSTDNTDIQRQVSQVFLPSAKKNNSIFIEQLYGFVYHSCYAFDSMDNPVNNRKIAGTTIQRRKRS